MKNYEIERISPFSAFKLFFLMGLIFGLILGLALVFVGASLNSLGFQLGITSLENTGSLQIFAIVMGAVFGSIVYGLLSGLIAVIATLLYNGFARMAGGIVIRLDERN
jgi:hypothetical protein